MFSIVLLEALASLWPSSTISVPARLAMGGFACVPQTIEPDSLNDTLNLLYGLACFGESGSLIWFCKPPVLLPRYVIVK
jgi:hypothetical protein